VAPLDTSDTLDANDAFVMKNAKSGFPICSVTIAFEDAHHHYRHKLDEWMNERIEDILSGWLERAERPSPQNTCKIR
jgi:hypothetical protein